jgi:trans-2,3-dihydro-3-hydroxyanthranilate isomerase
MRVPFRLVDVFTDRPLAGNQLCVIPEPVGDLGTETMQLLAREIGFSETTFVTRIAVARDRYDVRIFTPVEEIPFAGHPTLGTAFALASSGAVARVVTQVSAAGEVPVEIDPEAGSGRMRQLPPTWATPFGDRELVARAAGLGVDDLDPTLPMQIVSTGLGHLLVPVRSEAALRRAERDGRTCVLVQGASGAASVYLYAIRGDGDVVARMFDPSEEIGEDPATGSAAGPLGAQLALHGLAGMPGRIVISQGDQVGRPSRIEVDALVEGDDGWAIHVGGGVRIVGEGTFDI